MPEAMDVLVILFLFALGAALGSFLNVVVFRLPEVRIDAADGLLAAGRKQIRALSYPPSHCPRCGYQLRWYDNFPVLGWIWLGGKCRKCRLPISVRYPLIEAMTGLIFAGFYVAFFLAGPQWGPPTPAGQEIISVPRGQAIGPGQLPEGAVVSSATPLGPGLVPGTSAYSVTWRQMADAGRDWPMLAMTLILAFCLLAAALIDGRHFYIPRSQSFIPALAGLGFHTLFDRPMAPLSLMVGPVGASWAIGGGIGLLISLGLVRFGLLKRSFADELPPLEVDRDAAGETDVSDEEWARLKRLTRREMVREMAFLAPPILLGLIFAISAAYGPGQGVWEAISQNRAASAFCGSLLGGLVGGGVIWIIRILGSLGFGREAMGLGDVDLMFGVGCVLGAGPAGIAVFPAAIIGVGFALWRWASRSRHEMPFGPYLALASLGLVVFWNPLADYFRPSLAGLGLLLGPAGPLLGLE